MVIEKNNITQTIIVTFSSIRIKTKLQTIPDVLQKLDKLNGYTYFYKDTLGYSSKREQVGLIAQELQQVLPQLVDTLRQGEGLIGVNYAQLTAFLIEVNKAQQAQLAEQSTLYRSEAIKQQQVNDAVKAENAELRAMLDNLMKRMEKLEQTAE